MSKSVDNISAYVRNPDFLKKIAFNILEPSAYDNLEDYSLSEIINSIYDQYFGEKIPRLLKANSTVQINLEGDETPEATKLQTPTDIWIFGYGSLIWKVDFPFIIRKAGYIKGYERKFYQNSVDHRGIPEKPGRVVTLLPSPNYNSKVWGVGYRISSKIKTAVVQNLDVREKNGYDRLPVLFYKYPLDSKADEPIEMIAYVANENNSSYAGHIDDIDAIADQIFAAVGPSGSNREYVYKLANSMRKLFPGEEDIHLFDLESRLRSKENDLLETIDRIKDDIKEIIERGCLECTPVGDIRQKLKNLEIEK